MKTQIENPHTVLWADDDVDDLYIMREILERMDSGHNVVEVYNGQQVLNFLSGIAPHADLPCLIVLDINMPILDGRQTILNIRSEAQFNDIPIVVFTTSNSDKDRAFCLRHGVEMYTKPSAFTELEKVIEKLLNHCTRVEKSCN